MTEQPLIESGRERILSLGAETQFAPNGIVSRTLLRTESSRTVLFGFAEGQELTEHTSTQHALVQILSGECEFSLAGTPHQLKTGDLLYMPPNLAHSVKATRQFSMLLTLLHVMEKEGFRHSANPIQAGDWQVLFTRNPERQSAQSDPARTFNGGCGCSAPARIVDVDARGLEPPQPLVKILEATAVLPAGTQLRAWTDRRPLHLYSQLESRGFSAETEEQSDGSFLTHIRRR